MKHIEFFIGGITFLVADYLANVAMSVIEVSHPNIWILRVIGLVVFMVTIFVGIKSFDSYSHKNK